MLNHGGQLQAIKDRYPDVGGEWLDISTAIAPWSWPVPAMPQEVWQRLPESAVELCRQAAAYYGCNAHQLLAVAGSQVAIELLPQVLAEKPCRVAIPRWGYGEHAHNWLLSGHQVCWYDALSDVDLGLKRGDLDHIVVINPNNPTGWALEPETLKCWQQRLPDHGYLIIDEAFADGVEGVSDFSHMHSRRIVLRSVGKFFGMAGLRLGFVVAAEAVLERLRQRMPLWGVSHPAQWLGERMLSDRLWQQSQRQRIQSARTRLLQLLPIEELQRAGVAINTGPLFITLFAEGGVLPRLHEALIECGIVTRLFAPIDGRSGLRFGLADDAGLERLELALAEWFQSEWLQSEWSTALAGSR